MANKEIKEECTGCGKEYVLYSKATILGEIHYGRSKKQPNYIDHDHICLCPTCSKKVIQFLKETFGKMSPTSKYWKMGR
jgi:endogenous inhibitor of DNA gyrase (YacG/DUF329 family)